MHFQAFDQKDEIKVCVESIITMLNNLLIFSKVPVFMTETAAQMLYMFPE